jgi:DNA-binding beta-propeller fold protein YncE
MTPNSPRSLRPVGMPGLLILVLSCIIGTSQAAEPVPVKNIKPLFEITGGSAGRLSLPTDVDIGLDGHIYVVDGGNHRLVIFNRRGKHIRTIGQRGSANAEFLNPVGLCTDSAGRVYVADKDNQRVQVFSPDGQFDFSFAIKDNGKPVDPVDVAVSRDNKRVYVTGNNNHKVMVYSSTGRPLDKWGGEGVNKGEFRYPATLAVASNGRVYVVDVFNTRVQVFNATGKFALQFSGWGVLPGQVVRPKGVALDRRGRIYVSDSYMDVIQVFDDAHQFMHVLGTGNQPHRFTAAAGIAIDDTNRLYVAEVLKNRVSVYQLER